MKSVLYPGSFDPFTNGHLDLVVRARQLFDRVVVAVAVNSSKHPLFTLEERKQLIEKSCALLSNVEVVTLTGLLVDAIDDFHAQAILRGLRAFSDFEYELQMAQTNRKLLLQADTVFLTTSLEYAYLSSTTVREVAAFGGDISLFVPEVVADRVYEKFNVKNGEQNGVKD